uniref:C2H2-type domain-containing protein n=1 Tax=Anopheles dirus TaxID=7168 RepID=A0A182NXP9_9DIPT
MRSHSDGKPFSCTRCPKQYKSAAALKVHERRHNEEKNYICRVCERSFAHNSSLRLHVQKQHPDVELPAKGTVVSVKAVQRRDKLLK